jgi:hypothetical protein
MLRDSLRRLLTETDADKIGRALGEFGWFELLEAEPAEAVPALFEAQGEELATSPALGTVMAAALGSPTGTASVIVPGPGAGADPASGVEGTALLVSGYGLAGAGDAETLLVPVHRDGKILLATITDPTALVSTSVAGIDPSLGLVRLRGRVEVTTMVDGARWEAAVAAGRRALAHELLGLSRTMLTMAVGHARERRQFGRPIGAFQAIQHRLADAQVAVTAAGAAAAEAWADGPEPLSALLAKLWAGRAARLVGKHAQQTLGGVGFTWEHPFHRSLRRALSLDSLLGSAPELTVELGHHLVATGDIPQRASL